MKNKLSSVGIGKNKKTTLLLIALIVIPLVVGGLAYVQNQKNKNPQVLAASEAKDLVVKVGKLMDLPNETPTVATVSDAGKLAGQPFFAKAKNGDKVLIFTNSQKAVLYRPSTDKIIEVAFYNPPEVSPAPAPTTTVVASPSPTPAKSLRDLVGRPSPVPSVSPSPGRVSPTSSPAPTP